MYVKFLPHLPGVNELIEAIPSSLLSPADGAAGAAWC